MRSFFDILHNKIKLEYYMEYIMSLVIGACVYYKDCVLRVDNVKQGVVTRVEVIKNL